MGKLFGTDGARGIANQELTCELATNIGRAAAQVLAAKSKNLKPTVLIGKDTRASSDMLEMALAAGLCSVGANVILAGVLPTPAVAFLVKHCNATAGAMISASHNPCEYNGIKLFNENGYKLPDAVEDEIEALVFGDNTKINLPTGGEVGTVTNGDNLAMAYIDHIVSTAGTKLTNLKIALDCANGCAAYTAEQIFTKLGAECFMLNNHPDGVNINKNCGSTHLQGLKDFVKSHSVDLGLAFDGDSDRCLAVDSNGNEINGDQLMAVFARQFSKCGSLYNNTLVATVMSNIGLNRFAKENHLNLVSTAVGDRYVLEEMLKHGYQLGGEQSGHIIFSQYATTGDGQLTGVQFAAMMKQTGQSAASLAECMQNFPQTIVNVTATLQQKQNLKTNPKVQAAIQAAADTLGENGRILVRASGTEPLIRVMVEGQDINQIEQLAKSVAEKIAATEHH